MAACTYSLYPLRILRANGLSGDPLYQVTRANTINLILYAGPAWWGLTSAHDRERIERFCQKLERAGCVAEDSFDIDSLMDEADKGLLMAVVWNAEHVLRPHFPPVISRRSNLRPRTHNFRLPEKGDSNFIPRVVHRFSRTIQQSERLSFLIVLYHVVVCHHDLIKRRYIQFLVSKRKWETPHLKFCYGWKEKDHSTTKGQLFQRHVLGQGSPNPRAQMIKSIGRPERIGGKGRKCLSH